jgi:hypothetical protein
MDAALRGGVAAVGDDVQHWLDSLPVGKFQQGVQVTAAAVDAARPQQANQV